MAESQMAMGKLWGLKGSDFFDSEYLLLQVANYIHIHHLQSVAIDIGIGITDLDIIKGGKHIVQQRFRVLKKWMDNLPRNFTISQFIEKVDHWRQNGYVDRAVWRHLEAEGLDPEILPLSSAAERPASKRGVKRIRSPERPNTSSFSREDYEILSKEDANALQHLTRGSLSRQCGMMVANDWLEPDDADSLPVMEHYVDLEWTKLERGVENLEKDLPSLYSILDVVDPEKPPEGINLLIEAEPGMGKTWSTAYLALGWADNKCPQKSPLRRMDYVFWIRLREVDESSTLAETIVNQHDKIKPEHKKHLTEILEGKTKHRVLILMDGYDEYQPGSNSDIDDAINCSVGNCVLILTSRPKYLKNSIRSKFKGEVKIKGLSERKIDEFCELMLKENHKEFLEQAKATNIAKLFHIPIILYITLLIYKQKRTLDLPGSRAEVFKEVFELTIDRSTLKHLGCKSSEIQHLLFELGKMSWNSLNRRDVYLKMEDIQKASPDILKLGLLFEEGKKVNSIRPGPQYFAFQHKLFHEYAAAFYIAKCLESPDTQATLSEFFQSVNDIHKQEEVVQFTHGLMKNPASLVHHVGQLFVHDFNIIIDLICLERSLPRNLFHSTNRLFEAFFAEKKPHLVHLKRHNMYYNFYDHGKNLDLSPIYYPSQIYWFEELRQLPSISSVKIDDVSPNIGDISTCSMCVVNPDVSITEDLLRVCHKLSLEQPIAQLYLRGLKDTNDSGVKTKGEAMTLNLSQDAMRIVINDCVLDPQVISHLFSQIYRCVGLQQLICKSSIPHLEVDNLDLSRLSSLTILTLCRIDMSAKMCENICRDLKYLAALEDLSLSDIPIATSCCYLIESVSSMQPKSPLKNLFLSRVSIPSSMLTQLITALHNYPKMVQLNILDNEDKHGVKIEHKKASIEALPSMKDYSLENCNLPSWFCRQVLKSLSHSKDLKTLNLSGNFLTDTVQSFLSRDDESLQKLEHLELRSAGLGRNDLKHLKHVISQGKVPSLDYINLSSNNLEGTEDLVKDLVLRLVERKNPQVKWIELVLLYNNLSEDLLVRLIGLKKLVGRCCLLLSGTTVVVDVKPLMIGFHPRKMFFKQEDFILRQQLL